MSCPPCGSYFPPGYGHACVARAPLPSAADWFGPVAKKPRRTVCADCRWYCGGFYDSIRFVTTRHGCQHENARNLITGEPTSCSRNLGNCPDFQEKQP